MSLAPGTRLSVFELIEPIGRGGMGEVYGARDTKLDRDVAIKVLPEAFAHDAERLAENQLFVRALDQLAPATVAGLAAPQDIFVSPDGPWVGLWDRGLQKIAISGGPPVTLSTQLISGTPRGATWGEDGTIIFATAAVDTGLQSVSDKGGEVTVLTKPDPQRGELDHVWPEFLPGGQAVLFTITATTGGLDNAQIAVMDLSTNTRTLLLRGGKPRALCADRASRIRLVWSPARRGAAARLSRSSGVPTSMRVPGWAGRTISPLTDNGS